MSMSRSKSPAPRPTLPKRIDPAHIKLSDISRGPNWLFVRLHNPQVGDPQELVEELRDLCAKHFVYRLVLELEELDDMPEGLVTRLSELEGRLLSHGGALRLCGMTGRCELSLSKCATPRPLPNHPTRQAAVLSGGSRPIH